MEFRYKAIQVKQTVSGKMLTLFAAPSMEINQWVGIPQKKRFVSGEETAGFQREENPLRIKSLCNFYLNDDNIIQNPLLCATRDIPFSSVKFESENGLNTTDVCIGDIVINIPDFSLLTFKDIIGQVREYIESRVPELKTKIPSENLIASLKEHAAIIGHISNKNITDEEVDQDQDEEVNQEEEQDMSMAPSENGDSSSVLFEESHIIDFWQEIAARHEVLKLINEPIEGEEFLGFAREALLSYLRPIVLVDGQHRLRGALKAAQTRLNDPSAQQEIEERITNGETPEAIEADFIEREARRLPISLLMSSDPAEQVFQFVVVNQKATPIGRALLGTIVSTSLSNEEMDKVASRLKSAGIQLEESQAITYLARHPDSPFSGLIERGLTGDAKDLLQWNVFSSLIAIFRDLRGGKLFGQRNDYADIWRQRHLAKSAIVSKYEEYNCDNPYEYWRKLDGPWRDVFIKFWTKIRDTCGNTSDPDKHNYWGKPRESNLFNKISLTIIAADFFQYLSDTRTCIDSASQISELVDNWLEFVNKGYFDKDWNLSGVKKDSTGIRKQWAFLWSEYRKSGGNLPDRRLFRTPKGD